MLENTEWAMKKDNPEKLATQDTQDIGQINVREYQKGNEKGQSRETCSIRYTRRRTKKMLDNTEGVMKKENREKLAAQGTRRRTNK